jgi:hypothetical protein
MFIGIGETSLSGTLLGYNASTIFEDMIPEQEFQEIDNTSNMFDMFDIPIMEDLRIIPLLSSVVITQVENVTLFNTTFNNDITDNITEPFDLLPNIQQYHDVTINIRNGMSFFGTDKSTIEIICDAPFALSGFLEFPFDEETSIPVIGMLSESPSFLSYNGEYSIIYPALETTTITLTDMNGIEIWNKTGSETFLYLTDPNLQIKDTSPFHLYPVTSDTEQTKISLNVQSAEPQEADISTLLPLLEEIQLGSENMSLPLDFQNNSLFEDMISTVSQVTNGGMAIINYSSLSLNNNPSKANTFLFTRTSEIGVRIDNTMEEPRLITGQGSLFFLGDHFYTSQASADDQGVFIPLLPIIFWIFAVGFFIATKYYPLPDINETLDGKIKKYGLIMHILLLIITFLLIDLIVSSYFGVSFITCLFNQSFFLISIGFLGFQLLLWTLGYISCTIPLHIIFKTLFRFIGLNKSGKAISKAISTVGILIFTGFYTILLLNIVLYIVNPPIPTFPM